MPVSCDFALASKTLLDNAILCSSSSLLGANTSRVQRETETPGAQVLIYRIELAIARWKEEEQTSTTVIVSETKLLVFMFILVW